MVILIMTMVSPDPGQFIFRLKFAQLTDYFAQITSKRILSPIFHVNLNIKRYLENGSFPTKNQIDF